MNQPKRNRKYTVREVADLTGIAPKALRKRLIRGTVKGQKVDGRWEVDADDVARLTLPDHQLSSFLDAQKKRESGKDFLERDVAAAKELHYDEPPSDTDELLRKQGLDPDKWEVDSIKVNNWTAPMKGGEIGEMHQTNLRVTRKVLSTPIIPARADGDYIHPGKYELPDTDDPELVVLVGDQQAPFQDKNLHKLFCAWLHDYTPERGILIGDTIDLPEISRHPHKPEWAAKTQECIDEGYLVLRDYVQASENTRWQKLLGNHDERIRIAIINYLSDLHGLRRARVPGSKPEDSVFSVSNLLRLDELGVELVEPGGSYEHGQVKVTDKLAARHGWLARKGAGESAKSTLEHLKYSVIVGHTHRQGRIHKTFHDIDKNWTTLTAVETGCMCQIKGGLGYTPEPDWQNGFATASIWPDGKFSIDLATYVNGSLYWRDERYSTEK